jgi:hypothetical protein
MKARLLYRDRDFAWKWALQATAAREAHRTGRRYQSRDFDLHAGLPWNESALVQDLELDTLFSAMAGDDDCIFEVSRKIVLTGVRGDPDTIRYRQEILRDCLNHPDVIRELYTLAVAAVAKEKKHYLGTLTRYPDYVLRWSIELLDRLLGSVKKLRWLADTNADKFASEGWREFFATVQAELSDEYISSIEYHLARLRFRNGVLLSARLGRGNKAAGYVLHLPPGRGGTWLSRILRATVPWAFAPQPPVYSFSLHPRDEAGFRMLGVLRNRGIAIAANALGQSAGHVSDFFAMLRTELAFYVGCVNLHDRLSGKGEPTCMPSPAPVAQRGLSFRGLYDVCLALTVNRQVVGNDADADRKTLVVVTGANQGGKSTFLRSVGLAQLMMQCGMFVPAESFQSSLCDGLFTHYKREEDAGMTSGKFDEELSRMSHIVDHLTASPMILFNESFAATNEREGSEIARQITAALLERKVRMVFVTHLYEFARGVYESGTGDALFLRADRQADGTRTFRLIEGEPLQTSFGADLYDKVFGTEAPQRDAVKGKERAAPSAKKVLA